MKTSSGPTSLHAILLTLFLDLVGFSIVFPLYADLLFFYELTPGGLLEQLDQALAGAFDIGDRFRHVAFFGGVLTGIYSLIQFVVTPFWGGLSDRVGRRRVLLCTIGLNAGGYLVWVLAGSFELFLLSRLLGALASANISVASAAVADLADRKNRAKAMGMMGAAVGLGFITGPALGAAYTVMPRLDGGGTPGGLALNPFSTPALIALTLAVLNLVFVWRSFGETLPKEQRGKVHTWRSANPLGFFRKSLGPSVPTLNAAYLLFMTAFAGFEATLVFLAADRLGWGPGDVGILMVWVGFCSAVVQGGLVRRLVDRTGERKLALIGLALLIPGYALIALVSATQTPLLLYAGSTLLAVGVGCLSPTLSALVSFSAAPSAQGQVMGSYRSVGALGRALGPLLAAMLYFSSGPAAPYIASAVLAVLPLILILCSRTPEREALVAGCAEAAEATD